MWRRKKSNTIIDKKKKITKSNNDLFFSPMFQHRFPNNFSSGRKQQTALKHTIDRSKTWSKDTNNSRSHPYLPSSIIHNHQLINEDNNNWLKSSNTNDTPELELICQEEMLTDAQLQNYPTQVIISKFE